MTIDTRTLTEPDRKHRAMSILKTSGTILLNCCRILFFLALGAAFMIYS